VLLLSRAYLKQYLEHYPRNLEDAIKNLEDNVYPKQTLFVNNPAPVKLDIGGNRSGKTAICTIDVVLELEGKHPLQLAGLRHMPPMKWRAICVDFDAVDEKLEPEYEYWLPKRSFLKWDARRHILYTTNGSQVDFKTYEQEVNKFGQVPRDGIHFDEEPPEDIYNESLKRLIDRYAGRVVFGMTPEYGMTWVFDAIWLRGISNEKKDKDFWAINCEIWDNPYISDKIKKDFLDKITDPVLREIAATGKWVEFHGLVWPSFSRLEHTHDKFDLEWLIEGEEEKVQPTRYMAIDPMDRLIACLWMAIYPNGRIVFYDECLIEDASPREIADEIFKRDGGKIKRRWMDWHAWDTDPTSRSTLARELARQGVRCVKAVRDWNLGKIVVNEYLKKRDIHGKPKVIVFNTLTNLVRQLTHYVHDSDRRYERKHNPKNVPRKKDDHLADCFRYLLVSRPRYIEPVALVKKDPITGRKFRKSPVTGYVRPLKTIRKRKVLKRKGKILTKVRRGRYATR